MTRQTPDVRRRCPNVDGMNSSMHSEGQYGGDISCPTTVTSTTALLKDEKGLAEETTTTATTTTEGGSPAGTSFVMHNVRRLVLWDDLPLWQRDNQYIRSGYRPMSNSVKGSFRSLLYLHNETVNIYSHLLPSLLIVPSSFIIINALRSRYESASQADVIAFSCFFIGAAVCLALSATYHTLSNHSPRVARIGNALDYLGIVGLITGSFVPSVYYAFYCHPHLQMMYWVMICSIGVGCATVSVFNRFRSPEWRPFRAAMFVSMGLSAIFPVIHGLLIFGIGQMKLQIGLHWLLLQGFLYILGAYLYAIRVPEKWYPGRFDLLGSSHQIFHVLVVLAAMSHLTGLFQAFDYRHSGEAASCLV
ncbi:Hly-III-related protein [Ascosphaera apis ARSEF 7405]|uniref:Hly-III-related protein n=1 Tax=Ascosphaera apis ARSEF 7405 TaxID=392613 RepID=A0A168BSQ5_9EURO|nr:Hly-III-related protein [Ascosphaera apis ARSEF 7405]